MNTGSFLTDEIFTSAPVTAYVLIVAFIFGTVFGSFINCMAWRIANGEDPVKGRSHCTVCGHTLQPLDLIPVISYLMLRGRCRYCGTRISPRYVIAEVICGAGFVLCILRWGLSFDALRAILWMCMMLALSLVDIEISIIPDRFLIGGIAAWALTIPFVHQSIKEQLIQGITGALLLGGGMLLMSLLFDRLTGRESMGGGDIKLYFVCGLYLGWAKGLLCLILSCVIGLITAAALKKGRDTPFPFGPSICLACMICMLTGDRIVNWYLSFFR